MATAQDVYERTVRQLPPRERLRLASLILNQLTDLSASELDISDAWSEEDVRDITAFALRNSGAAQTEGGTDA